MKEKEFTFDASYQPQVRTKTGTTNIMLDVIIALVPAMGVAVWQFGLGALMLIAVSVASCVFFEWGYRKLMKKDSSIGDLSACVTGVLLAMVIPSSAPWWMPIVGAAFAMIVVKQLFGGLGKNFLNPALAGRAFLMASWPVIMTTWVNVDATAGATPLTLMKAGTALPESYSYVNMLVGNMPGCIGEVSAIALLIGGLYLIIRKVISWRIPVSFIGTVAVITLILPRHGGFFDVDWMLQNLLTGGLFLGAFFMATDYSTSPVTLKGQLVYGFGCGALTVLIRYFGGYPEGVSYAILIMNLCAWAIDKGTRARQFGVTKEDLKAAKKAAKEAKA